MKSIDKSSTEDPFLTWVTVIVAIISGLVIWVKTQNPWIGLRAAIAAALIILLFRTIAVD